MQKLLLFIFALQLSFGVMAQTSDNKSAAPVVTSWGRITDTTYTLRFPENWMVDQSGMFGARFFIFSPFDSVHHDKFRENFNLIMNDMSAYPNMTLEYLADGSKQQVESMINDVKVQEFRIVHEGDAKYYIFEYSGKQGEFNLHWKQRYWFAYNKFYVLTFTAEESQYANYLPIAEHVFSSFMFR